MQEEKSSWEGEPSGSFRRSRSPLRVERSGLTRPQAAKRGINRDDFPAFASVCRKSPTGAGLFRQAEAQPGEGCAREREEYEKNYI